MPRANRYFLPGGAYHLTHRCHNKSWLFRFARDRTEYCRRLRDCLRSFDFTRSGPATGRIWTSARPSMALGPSANGKALTFDFRGQKHRLMGVEQPVESLTLLPQNDLPWSDPKGLGVAPLGLWQPDAHLVR
jgi:hypothetical protein